MGIKFANFWNAYQYDDLSIIKLLRDEGVLGLGLRFGFIAALGLAGLILTVGRFPKAGWIVAAVLLHMCALLPVFVTERYRLAAVPGLMILGAAGLAIFWQDLVSSRWARAGVYIAICAGAAWFVSIPRNDIGLWSLDYYKAGIRATTAAELEQERGDFATAAGALDRAQGNLETAYAYVSNNADIDFALGNLWLARSNQPANDARGKTADVTEAKLFYRKALQLAPHHTGTLNNLGVLAMEEKRWKLAATFFTGALESEPDDAKTHYLLARVYAEDNQLEAARAEVETALRLRPNQKQFLELREKLARDKTPNIEHPAPNIQ